MKDYYYILRVTNAASLEDIKTAYYKLAKKFHPDNNDGDKFFEERFKDIQEAYEYLSKNIHKVPFGPPNNNNNNKHQSSNGTNKDYSESIIVEDAVLHKFEMVFIKGGHFDMGGTHLKAHIPSSKKLKYPAKVESFFMGKYPVTNGLWIAIMENNRKPIKSLFEKKAPLTKFEPFDAPVRWISWEQAVKFIKRLNEITGKNYRLPTHEEWEFSALGGVKSNGFLYSGSDILDDVGWWHVNSHSSTVYGRFGREYKQKINPVGLKNPNELGLYDMSGSVFEYCSDAPGNNLNQRFIKGGGYQSWHWSCEVKAFETRDKNTGNTNDGLWLAISL